MKVPTHNNSPSPFQRKRIIISEFNSLLGRVVVLEETLIKKLKAKAKLIRRHIIEMTYRAGSGHPGGSLSATDIITALYFKILNHNPKNPKWNDRDRFVLSKGHACPALYAALAEAGYFPVEELFTLRKLGTRLQGHPSVLKLDSLEASTGSLGQGLSMAIGLALAAKLDKKSYKVYVLLGDGEANEGNIWEAAMFASHHGLDNLTAFLDRNKIQLDDFTEKIVSLEPLADKWKAFGWEVLEIDGHDFRQILQASEQAKKVKEKPTIIIAHTTKGKGISFMENTALFHGKAPDKEQYEQAMKELL